MEISLDTALNEFNTSSKQIELIESIEYVHTAEMDLDEMLSLRSINAFAKRYFENELCKYKQVISVSEGMITCKVFVDGKQVSEATARSFNHARVQAAILALQDRNFDLLKTWLEMHKAHLQAYLSI
ncbi:hypothetical protein SteCoe_21761 [Stentor coeruleus]|uniref:DRBM domain-containing protein n=1 Tax=Stentor coeruleus TaxID=5963 RepID=A0A1R2BNV5_9CILI|nr:hypothetical protein SteCoe_21761 [Stentor coeruleus]